MSGATRQEAEGAIGEVNKQLALAQGAHDAGDVDLVRKLVDSAKQALKEGDYLTARSLAQKASVLASHLTGTATSAPSSPSH